MEQYINLVKHVLKNGTECMDRTGVGTIRCFGHQTRYDLRNGFPLLTTKKVNYKSLIAELIWFLRGETNINSLKEIHPTRIWDDWADEKGDLGPVYGSQWRNYTGVNDNNNQAEIVSVDQIKTLIDGLKSNPASRRHIVNSWNVPQIDKMGLPPCHCFFQCFSDNTHLDLQLYQRSADVALGVPFNIASYAFLMIVIAKEVGLKPRYFIHTFGDVHIYKNHVAGLMNQIKREPRPLPNAELNSLANWRSLKLTDFAIHNYYPHEPIKFEIAV